MCQDKVDGRCSGHGAFGWQPGKCVTDLLCTCFCEPDGVTVIQLQCRSQVSTSLAMWCPGVLVSGFLCMRTQMPGSAKVQLKSNESCSCAQANKLGLMCEPWRRLRDNSACGSSQSQRWMGKFLSAVLQRPAMKWFLEVRMTLSMALWQCKCSGTSW